MATTKESSENLYIYEDKFSRFIEINRRDLCGNNLFLGVRVLARFVGVDFFDIKLYVNGGKFIIARFRMKDMYFVGYARSTDKKPTWYTLSELEPTSSSSPASSSSNKEEKKKAGKSPASSSSNKKEKKKHGKSPASPSSNEEKEKPVKFKRVSIKDSNTMDWDEKFTDYTGGYVGANSMLAVAGGGGGNEKKEGVQLKGMRLGKETIAHAVHDLLKYDPTNRDDSYTTCARSFVCIALTIAEPLRFELLKNMIIAEWSSNGYEICDDGVYMIKNWDSLSSYVLKNKYIKQDQPIVEVSGHVKTFLDKHKVKFGRDLQKIFGIVMDSEKKEVSKEMKKEYSVNSGSDTDAHNKSKAKGRAKMRT